MISYIKGEVISKSEKYLTIVANGIGYKIFTTSKNIENSALNTETEYYTYLAVRENALDLYGFSSTEESDFFELLLTVSGIGPKTALGILDVASPETLRTAIVTKDSSHLTRVSGIGKKNAEKIVLELATKVEALESDSIINNRENDGDVMEALLALGYNPKNVREILSKIPSDVEGTENRIKYALKDLGK